MKKIAVTATVLGSLLAFTPAAFAANNGNNGNHGNSNETHARNLGNSNQAQAQAGQPGNDQSEKNNNGNGFGSDPSKFGQKTASKAQAQGGPSLTVTTVEDTDFDADDVDETPSASPAVSPSPPPTTSPIGSTSPSPSITPSSTPSSGAGFVNPMSAIARFVMFRTMFGTVVSNNGGTLVVDFGRFGLMTVTSQSGVTLVDQNGNPVTATSVSVGDRVRVKGLFDFLGGLFTAFEVRNFTPSSVSPSPSSSPTPSGSASPSPSASPTGSVSPSPTASPVGSPSPSPSI